MRTNEPPYREPEFPEDDYPLDANDKRVTTAPINKAGAGRTAPHNHPNWMSGRKDEFSATKS